MLLHELGHIRRGDCPMLLLGRLACVAYWFHPLAWLAARQLRKTSEQAADDLVLASHIAPPDYAEHLVGIAAQMRGLHLFGHVALPMASPSDLEGRVRAILDPRRNHRSLKRKTCYALMTLAVLLVVPCAILRLGYAEDKKSESIPAEKGVPRSEGARETKLAASDDRKDRPELAVAEAKYNVAKAKAEDDIDVRYAIAAAAVAKAEYDARKKLLKRTPVRFRRKSSMNCRSSARNSIWPSRRPGSISELPAKRPRSPRPNGRRPSVRKIASFSGSRTWRRPRPRTTWQQPGRKTRSISAMPWRPWKRLGPNTN